MEQISHHPPVSAFHIEGPGSSYRFVGLSEPTVSLLLLQGGFKTVAKGTRYVELPDGTHIDIVYPAYCMKGIANSTLGSFGIAKGRPRAIVEGTAVFTDAGNCLRGVVRFGANKSAIGVNKHILKRLDAVHGEVYDLRDIKEAMGKLGGQMQSSPKASDAAAADEEYESASETDWDQREDPPMDDPPSHTGSGEANSRTGSGQNVVTSAQHQHAEQPPASAGPVSELTLQPEPEKLSRSSGSVFGKFFGSNSSQSTLGSKPEDQELPGRVVSRLQGSWLSHLDFDGVRFWALQQEQPDVWSSVPNPLKSDSRFREDLAMLAQGADTKAAQDAKERLEKLQRNDKKLRGNL